MAKVLKENEIESSTGTVYQIKAVKMKYMKEKFLDNYMYLKTFGVMKVLNNYSDGEATVKNFLTAVFDSEEIADKAIEELDSKAMNQILEITKKINEIEDESEIKNETTPVNQ